MEIETISLLGAYINNVANIPHGSVINLGGIHAYSVENGIVEEYQIIESTENLSQICKDNGMIGTINYFARGEYVHISVGLLWSYQDIQLVVDIPYEVEDGI